MFFKPKTAKDDFQKGMLPQTRRQVFFDVVKYHPLKLVVCGLIILLFDVPLILSTVMQDLSSISVWEKYRAETITAEEAYKMLKVVQSTSAVANIFFYILVAIALAGVARIIKLLAWEENTYVGHDYFKGVRQNILQFLILGIITSLLIFVCNYVRNSTAYADTLHIFLGYIPTLLCAVFLAPIGGYTLVCITVYKVPFTKSLRYASIAYGKNIFKTFLACFVCFLPFVVQLIPEFYCHLLGSIISAFFVPFVMLGWFLFAFNSLDKTINKEYYPELYKKGLYLPEAVKGETADENINIQEKGDLQNG